MNALETVDASIVEVYKDKTGLDENEIEQLMTAETWFTSKDAVEKGFADKLKDTVETPKETQEDVENNSEMMTIKNEIEGLKIQLSNLENSNNKPKKKRYL